MIAILGAGYIGSALCARLRALGCDVEAFGRHDVEAGKWRMAETVIHACGPSGEVATLADLSGAIKANAFFIGWLGAWLRDNRRRTVIYLSSMSVYAGQPPFSEADEASPMTVYAALKRVGEMMLMRHFRTVVLRLAHVYGVGAGARYDPHGIVNAMVTAALSGKAGEICGHHARRWDYLHVDDLADAIIALFGIWHAPAIINLGMGGITMRELESAICAATGREPFFVYDGDESAEERALDTSLARGSLGWRPRVSLKDGIAELARWRSTT